MCNDPVSKKYLAKILLPLDYRMMALFDTEGKNSINARWIISTTLPHFSGQHTIKRKKY